MYDDGHVYTDKAGSLKWKFVPTEPAKEASLSQKDKVKQDTYDHDPTTTSMYDDGHVYTDKPGSLNWKKAAPKAKNGTAEAKAPAEEAKAEAAQAEVAVEAAPALF